MSPVVVGSVGCCILVLLKSAVYVPGAEMGTRYQNKRMKRFLETRQAFAIAVLHVVSFRNKYIHKQKMYFMSF